MPITFDCPCGYQLCVGDGRAGQTVDCPRCGEVLAVPERPDPAPGADGADPHDGPKKIPGVASRPVAKKNPEFHGRPARTADRPTEADEGDGTERPKAGQWDRGRRGEDSSPSLEGKVFNSGVAGGLLAMLIAVVWFVAGLANDVIFFYPPILFVIGLVALFKGLAGPK